MTSVRLTPAGRALRWAVFALAAFVMNFPVLATLVTAFKSPAEITRNPSLLIESPTLENFAAVLTVTDRLNIYHYLWNSFAAALIGALLPMILCFPAAWAMARRGTGQRLLFPLIVNLRALPLVIFAIPLYLMYAAAGLLDTRLGLGLILAVVNLPLAMMLVLNAVADIPAELEEAARVDGAGLGYMLRRVVLPLCRPALVTTFIFGFITAWNEFLFGLIMTTREAVPVTVGASFFFATSGGGVQWGMASAVMIVAALPPLLLGLVMYRRIAGSMVTGAVKG
jgi:multiple sugar transport system permease protein